MRMRGDKEGERGRKGVKKEKKQRVRLREYVQYFAEGDIEVKLTKGKRNT